MDGYRPAGKEVIQIGTDREKFRDSGCPNRKMMTHQN